MLGGPYELPSTIYTELACLNDGNYVFTVYDSMSDGIGSPGYYVLWSGGETVSDSRDDLIGLGSSKSTPFVVRPTTRSPTQRPTTRSPTRFPTRFPTNVSMPCLVAFDVQHS